MTSCVLLHLPPFVKLKMGTIYPGPKAAIIFHHCKKLLKLMLAYDTEAPCNINRMWPKEKRNRGSNFSKAFFPLASPQNKAEPQQASKMLDSFSNTDMLTVFNQHARQLL